MVAAGRFTAAAFEVDSTPSESASRSIVVSVWRLLRFLNLAYTCRHGVESELAEMRFAMGRWLALCGVIISACGANAADVITFESHVRPILKTHCFHCHGEEPKVEGQLDVRLARFLMKGGESGAAIVAGQHRDSLLWKRISSGEMPPGEKKLSEKEKQAIAQWINGGAKTARPEPESLSDDGITDDERAFWSFQPVRRPTLPSVKKSERVRSPIDVFLLARLEGAGQTYGDDADRVTFIRRATFDLLGLPPTPDEVDDFVSDEQPDACERLIDRLLASPHYGERWARHWLDVVGYADSDGYGEKDLERKWAFKYRDWLVRAFNADRPWDELIREQLAGDELLTPPLRGLTADDADKLVATGFLRMAPDGTGDAAVTQDVARNECVAETIKIVSTSLLGLTVGCAQCHSHRYDPISQVDYFRLRAVFEPALNWKDWKTPQQRLVSLWTPEQISLAKQCDADIKRLEKERLEKYEALSDKLREDSIAKLDDELKQRIRDAAKTLVAKRTLEQKKLLTDYPKAAIPVGTLLERNAKDEYKAITDEYAKLIDEQRKRRPVEDFAHCLHEPLQDKWPTTQLFFRGDFNQPKQEVAPGELAVLTSPGTPAIAIDDARVPTSGRRLAYARWLTSGQHPLVARVFVNRVWLHHFGRGLVGSPGDFGRLGETPSHPELLDWLAAEFVGTPTASGADHSENAGTLGDGAQWSLKRLHRVLMNSTAYRQSSRRRPDLEAVDPDNRWLGRMSVRRLESEIVRDAVLTVSGQITRKFFGEPIPITPDETGQIIVGVDTRDTAGRPTGKRVPLNGEEFRRSLYITVRRSMPLAMLETFDAAMLAPNCTLRTPSTGALQSLLLLNNDFIIQQSDVVADRIIRDIGHDRSRQIEWAWRLANGHRPDQTQVAAAQQFVSQQIEQFQESPDAKVKSTAEKRALASLCQALLISNGFLYVD